MSKIDFKKTLKHLYQPAAKDFSIVEVPALQFLMVDGRGDPNTAPAYTAAVEALYSLAYKIKFLSKKELDRDYTVPPLEGLWWADDMDAFTASLDKSAWIWTMMIMQPDWIDAALLNDARAEVSRKKALPALEQVRLERYDEGSAVQIMHIGSYDDEAPTLARMHHEFIPANGLEMHGKHHEIYLSDPRRVVPEKLKTVLRQPVRRA